MLRKVLHIISWLEQNISFVLSLVLLQFFISAFILIYIYSQFNHSAKQVNQNKAILLQCEKIQDQLLTIESNARAYALTGNEVYLKIFQQANTSIEEHLNQLHELTANGKLSAHDFTQLKNFIEAGKNHALSLIKIKDQNGIDAAVKFEQTDNSKNFVDRIRNHLLLIEEEQQKLQQLRERDHAKWKFRLQSAFFVLLILMSVVLIIIFLVVRNNLQKRYAAEKQLQLEKQLLQNIFDNTSTLIYMKDPTGRYLLTNKRFAEVFGLPSTEMIGKRDSDFFDAETIKKIRIAEMKIFNGGEVVEVEEEAEMQGNKRIYLSVKFPLRDSGGSIYAVCGMCTDITERKSYESQIITLNKRLEENVFKLNNINRELEAFTYTVSHDLRSPLRAINGFASLLINKSTEKNFDDETLRIIQMMRENSLQMGQLIDDLLAFSKVGRYKPNLQVANMQEIVVSVLKQIGQSIDLSKISVNIQQLESAVCDPNLIKQVWANLVSNAIKFSANKSNPQIQISSSIRAEEVVYCIQDNGAGFNMQYYNKLFGMFQRLHSSNEFEGTGVGLAIVNRIVKRHSGKVWAESVPGEGATFYFSLPKEPKFIEV